MKIITRNKSPSLRGLIQATAQEEDHGQETDLVTKPAPINMPLVCSARGKEASQQARRDQCLVLLITATANAKEKDQEVSLRMVAGAHIETDSSW